ncbi:hypothetical protein P3T73_14480 [Kiritimatiellota bacterium B12222]|nr:hypothetical protein P3T73_14480 [Kiritimatiellota bacterium B12222]
MSSSFMQSSSGESMMLSRFSISNFKLFHNAGFWALLIIVLIESLLQAPLRKRFHRHHVDRLVQKVDEHTFDAPVLILGDSIAENVFRRVVPLEDRFAVFASNQAIEMTGQSFILQRYLAHNPQPAIVVLMAGMPMYGDLEQIFTENYIQRVFIHWSEIAWMAQHTLDPVFISKCIAYKCSPTFRYRQQIRESLRPHKSTEAGPVTYTAPQVPKWSASYRLNQAWKTLRNKNASEKALETMLSLTAEAQIPFVYIPPPGTQQAQATFEQSMREMSRYQNTWPHLEIWEEERAVFPEDNFFDGTHFNDQGYRHIRPYQEALFLRILTTGQRIDQQTKDLRRLNMSDIKTRNGIHLPQPFLLANFYPIEGIRSHAFQWTQPEFELTVNGSGNLILETAAGSPPGILRILSGSPHQAFKLTGGKQILTIPLSSDHERLRFSFPPWKPDSNDNRTLGIAIEALGLAAAPAHANSPSE